MEEFVEGEWNGFYFRQAVLSDEPEIEALLHANYFPDDAVTVTSGLADWSEYENDYKKLWMAFIPENLSFVAIDIATNKMAGVRINFEHRKGMDLGRQFGLNSPQMRILATCKAINDKTAALFEKYPEIDKYAILIIACISSDFRRRGLATEMYKRSINLLRAKGYFLAKSNFNNPYSRRAAYNLGFVEVARLSYADLRDEQGNVLLPKATREHLGTQGVYFLQDQK